jgi:Tol biopolymer transport system component
VIVGPDQFPPGDPTLTLGALSMSPDGERIAFQRYSGQGGYQIWVSTVRAAGTPVLLASNLFYEDGPSWSPDGGSIAFLVRTNKLTSALAIKRIGTDGDPQIVVPSTPELGMRPQWSPDGSWILVETNEGVDIVSPDGKQKRRISEETWMASTWAEDNKHVYVIREAEKPRHYALTSLDVDTREERVINPDLGPLPHASQPIRGLTRSGRGTIATSVATARSDIWVMDNFVSPPRLLERLLPWK